jgi:anti-sigma factor ChrR (cupin superfamily)
LRINADLSLRCVIDTASLAWTASPEPGVERKPLDRDGGEVARATSIVRFAPGSAFPAHEHGAGEEFLVLDGVFSDEFGDYPAGSYVRNPPGSRHAPASRPGCTLFVKLRQFDPGDRARVSVATGAGEGWRPGPAPGVEVLPLYRFGSEEVRLERWAAGAARGFEQHVRGEEILVLSGVLADERGSYPAGTWLRNPPGSGDRRRSAEGCLVYVKTGHLPV